MDKKTEGVEELVKEVLVRKFSEPYSEDIILEVFQEIEKDPEWLKRYKSLSNDLSDDFDNGTLNQWIGKYVSSETGMKSLKVVVSEGKCSLINSYSKLGW